MNAKMKNIVKMSGNDGVGEKAILFPTFSGHRWTFSDCPASQDLT
jgi:hypothetical protein